jgi:hypothetical protein
MKKSELKNIIKECVKEVIFEEGVLSGIITEVAKGMGSVTFGNSNKTDPTTSEKPNHLIETRQKILAAVGNEGYADLKNKFQNPELFEGTRPLPSEGHGALSSVAPGDRGIDISNLPGMHNWGKIASGNEK